MSTSLQKSYNELLARCKDVYVLQSAMGIVNWDMQTKMPPAGVSLRGPADQTGALPRPFFSSMSPGYMTASWPRSRVRMRITSSTG